MKRVILLILLLSAAILVVSCDRDTVCDRNLSVHSRDGINDQIADVGVYIYDADGKLLGFEQSKPGEPINVERYRPYGHIKVVVWGNVFVEGGQHTLSPPIIGGSSGDHTLIQNPSGETFAGMPLTNEPSDIFYGATDIYFSGSDGGDAAQVNTPVYVDRSVASYALTIRNIGAATDGPTADYKVVVRHPYSGLDFAGNPIGGETIYMPDVRYDPVRDELTTDINRALPTGTKGMVIEVYSGDTLVYSTAVDDMGRPIMLESNKLHNILFDLNREGYIWIIVTDWDEVVIFEGFS